MHSDEQASVNELLVQIDRVLRLGRLLAATTNFIDSMDDAVMRSGRFGRFIPVPPPNAQESVEILAYYLRRLADQPDTQRTSNVRVPEQDRLPAIIEPLYEENRENKRFYCGADLEEAVYRAYSRSVRRAWPVGGWSQESSSEEVHLTEEDLKKALIEVPRSIQADAVDQFLSDIGRYCDREIAESMSNRLCPIAQGLEPLSSEAAIRGRLRTKRSPRRFHRVHRR
jgi:SpoVK/Ycf46/Vps4 family AAA+-type ATPase